MRTHQTMRPTWVVTSYLGTFRFMRAWELLPNEATQVVHPLEARSALTAEASRGAFALTLLGEAVLGGYRPAHYNVRTHQPELLKELFEAIDSKRLVAIREPPPRPPVMVPSDEVSSESPRKPAQAVRAAPARDRYLRLRLMGGGEPRSNKAYVLKLDDGTILKGKTSGDGVLVEKLTPTVRRAKLRLESAGLGVDESSLDLDALAPPSGLSGVQQRLRNEGLLERVTGSLDEATRAALSVYQERHKVAVSGEADRDTQAKLEETHGS